MKNKIYLVEIIDENIKRKLEEEFIITNDIALADILITRNIRVNKEFIDKAKNLKLVCIHGTGISEVDIPYCHEKGIKVFNTPYMNVESVAEFAIQFLYQGARLKKEELFGKKLLIVGYGHIGKKIHELVMPLQMDVSICRRNDNISNLIQDRDFIILAASLNASSYHLINEEVINHMKKNSILINIARGDLVDEEAIISGLKKNTIAYYLSDVFHNEPNINPELLKLNCIATKHIASNTKEALYKMGDAILKGIHLFLENQMLENEL